MSPRCGRGLESSGHLHNPLEAVTEMCDSDRVAQETEGAGVVPLSLCWHLTGRSARSGLFPLLTSRTTTRLRVLPLSSSCV